MYLLAAALRRRNVRAVSQALSHRRTGRSTPEGQPCGTLGLLRPPGPGLQFDPAGHLIRTRTGCARPVRQPEQPRRTRPRPPVRRRALKIRWPDSTEIMTHDCYMDHGHILHMRWWLGLPNISTVTWQGEHRPSAHRARLQGIKRTTTPPTGPSWKTGSSQTDGTSHRLGIFTRVSHRINAGRQKPPPPGGFAVFSRPRQGAPPDPNARTHLPRTGLPRIATSPWRPEHEGSCRESEKISCTGRCQGSPLSQEYH